MAKKPQTCKGKILFIPDDDCSECMQAVNELRAEFEEFRDYVNEELPKKLEALNIIAGEHITVTREGNNVTISGEGIPTEDIEFFGLDPLTVGVGEEFDPLDGVSAIGCGGDPAIVTLLNQPYYGWVSADNISYPGDGNEFNIIPRIVEQQVSLGNPYKLVLFNVLVDGNQYADLEVYGTVDGREIIVTVPGTRATIVANVFPGTITLRFVPNGETKTVSLDFDMGIQL